MQTYRVCAIIDIEAFSEQDAVKDFYDLVKDNKHLGFVNGQVTYVEEYNEEEI